MTTPSSCPAHKKNATKQERTKNRLAHQSISKKDARYAPHHPPLSILTLLHKNLHLCKAQTSRHEHILRVMPPRCTRQPPTHNLFWFSTPQCQAVLHQVHGLIDECDRRDRRRLKKFRHHIRAHDIPYLWIAPSLRLRSTLPSILPHFTPLAPHTRLRPTESENPSPSPPS